jgi:hypothetical protein
MQSLIRLLVVAVLIAVPFSLMAQTQARPRPPGTQPLEEAPPPPAISEDATLSPQVTIKAKGEDKVEEYRIRGKLYKMRVVPAAGAAYWLVDPKGDGSFVRVDGPTPNIAVPMWVILEF